MNDEIERDDAPPVLVAAVTPRRAGRFDRTGFESNLRTYRAAGLQGVLCGGSTGRGDALDTADLIAQLTLVRAQAPGLEIMAGMGARPRTADELGSYIELAERHADSLLVPPPEDDAEVLPFYEALVGLSELPLYVYQPPGRKDAPFPTALATELASLDGLAGVKDSTGHEELIAAWRAGRPGFRLLLGNLDLFARRAADVDGAILAFANLRPGFCLGLARGRTEAEEIVGVEHKLVQALGLEALEKLMDIRGLRGDDLPD